MNHEQIVEILGHEAEYLLNHQAEKIPANLIRTPSLDGVLEISADSARIALTQANLQRLYESGRLGGSGYLSIFPVDQGLEHSALYSFYQNPRFFDPVAIVEMAIAGGCSGVTSSLGVLSLVAEKYAEQIPFIVKLNHSEHLSRPLEHTQILFANVEEAARFGAAGVGATIYFGSDDSPRQIAQVAAAFAEAHANGLFTILWCYPRSMHYDQGEKDYSEAADITAQAIHLGVSLGADIVKQKMPTPLRGIEALELSHWTPAMYEALQANHPIDLVRLQVLHAYAGRIGLINSGGEARGEDDLRQAVRSAVINKRAGGQGLIMGRKVFKRSWEEGVAMLQAVQDVYLDEEIGLA